MNDATGRVAHLSTVHPPRDNRIFHKECRALRNAGLDVWLIIPQDGNSTDFGISIHGLPKRNGRAMRMVRGQMDAWRALNRVKPDLVHVHDPELVPLIVAWKIVHRRRAIYDAHEDLEKQIASKPYVPTWARWPARVFARALVALANQMMDGIVAATPSIARSFCASKSITVHNYPWLSEFPEPVDREPVPGGMVYVGGMSEIRSFSTMIKIVDEIPNGRLLLAGPMDQDVEQQYLNLPEGSPVEYAGRLPAKDVPGVIAKAHLGLVLFKHLPNHRESLPTKLFEYMASGIPFVATDFAYWRALLGGYECGKFVDVDDPRQCVDAVEMLLTNPKLCQEMGKRGREAVIERFNFDKDAEALVGMTRSLLGPRSSARTTNRGLLRSHS